jgi:hypothetical protein
MKRDTMHPSCHDVFVVDLDQRITGILGKALNQVRERAGMRLPLRSAPGFQRTMTQVFLDSEAKTG